MENLTTYQIMALYLLAFQICEGPQLNNSDHIEEALDHIFRANGCSSIEGIMFDEDGAPIGSGKAGVYVEFNTWLDSVKDDEVLELIPLGAFEEDNISITPELLISLIPAKAY